jgi:hypothetical protein
MRKLEFIVVKSHREMYEVYSSGAVLGTVWKAGDAWYADRYSTAAPSIKAATRELAAQKLR